MYCLMQLPHYFVNLSFETDYNSWSCHSINSECVKYFFFQENEVFKMQRVLQTLLFQLK